MWPPMSVQDDERGDFTGVQSCAECDSRRVGDLDQSQMFLKSIPESQGPSALYRSCLALVSPSVWRRSNWEPVSIKVRTASVLLRPRADAGPPYPPEHQLLCLQRRSRRVLLRNFISGPDKSDKCCFSWNKTKWKYLHLHQMGMLACSCKGSFCLCSTFLCSSSAKSTMTQSPEAIRWKVAAPRAPTLLSDGDSNEQIWEGWAPDTITSEDMRQLGQSQLTWTIQAGLNMPQKRETSKKKKRFGPSVGEKSQTRLLPQACDFTDCTFGLFASLFGDMTSAGVFISLSALTDN